MELENGIWYEISLRLILVTESKLNITGMIWSETEGVEHGGFLLENIRWH